jgi:hypothetical protein
MTTTIVKQKKTQNKAEKPQSEEQNNNQPDHNGGDLPCGGRQPLNGAADPPNPRSTNLTIPITLGWQRNSERRTPIRTQSRQPQHTRQSCRLGIHQAIVFRPNWRCRKARRTHRSNIVAFRLVDCISRRGLRKILSWDSHGRVARHYNFKMRECAIRHRCATGSSIQLDLSTQIESTGMIRVAALIHAINNTSPLI